MNMKVHTYGDPGADIILIQMVSGNDLEDMDREVAEIKELTYGKKFCLKAVAVNSWNQDLPPWPAEPILGKEEFGSGAQDTLAFLEEHLFPKEEDTRTPASEAYAATRREHPERGSSFIPVKRRKERIYLGGYSLAALFAIWAGFQTDQIDGIAAASPSVWYPGFVDYMREHEAKVKTAYLSLGNREARTRNPVMSQVAVCFREAVKILRKSGTVCMMEWNEGNHFRDPELRTAKGFAWLINRGGK